MRTHPAAALAVVVLLALAGCSVGYQPDAGPDEAGADTDGPTPDADLGRYDGYWHNDTFGYDPESGLSPAQREAVVSRAMARVQVLRGLEFEDDVEVEFRTREEFREDAGAGGWPEPPEGVGDLDDVQHEALFTVGPDEDVHDVRRGNQGDLVMGYYEPESERLVFVSERDPATVDDEITLAHELVHALQDQHFGLDPVVRRGTVDGQNARGALVEGDAVTVGREYESYCESGAWECAEVDGGHQTGETGPEFHYGVYFVDFFRYAEGPSFVEHHRDADGWAAVDAMFDDPPTAAAEAVYPESYGEGAYGEATLADRNDADWERIEPESGPDHGVVGQSGLASMFAYTAFDGEEGSVVDADEFRNADADGDLDSRRPFTYDLAYAEGWYADRLHAYERDGDTAYVWNVTFTDAEEAAEFAAGHERVVEYHGGEAVGGDARDDVTVWSLADSDEFDGAVRVEREGDVVTVVKAPAESELDDVYAPAGE